MALGAIAEIGGVESRGLTVRLGGLGVATEAEQADAARLVRELAEDARVVGRALVGKLRHLDGEQAIEQLERLRMLVLGDPDRGFDPP